MKPTGVEDTPGHVTTEKSAKWVVKSHINCRGFVEGSCVKTLAESVGSTRLSPRSLFYIFVFLPSSFSFHTTALDSYRTYEQPSRHL